MALSLSLSDLVNNPVNECAKTHGLHNMFSDKVNWNRRTFNDVFLMNFWINVE